MGDGALTADAGFTCGFCSAGRAARPGEGVCYHESKPPRPARSPTCNPNSPAAPGRDGVQNVKGVQAACGSFRDTLDLTCLVIHHVPGKG